jgi:hypothetical protein
LVKISFAKSSTCQAIAIQHSTGWYIFLKTISSFLKNHHTFPLLRMRVKPYENVPQHFSNSAKLCKATDLGSRFGNLDLFNDF